MPSFLRRVFRTAASRVSTVEATLYSGYETLEVVGESHHQDALWQLVGGHTEDRVRYETHAILVPDPDNRYDENAIEVRIDGLLVGHLSRGDAAVYKPGLLRLIETSTNGLVALHAVIVGGGHRRDGIGYLGVFLDHDPADFGLASHHTSNDHIRTGLSEAIATDLEDDGYDLSWYKELAEDDLVAIRQLRSLLERERELVSRHYMFCELENRLYRCRTMLPSALDEFDAVCVQHHTQIESIRPALLEKFGVVPVIEMYRQATVRAQKAKQWETAREWAERGVATYGDTPARKEVVDDLRKRIAYAAAKIEAAQLPRPKRPLRMTVDTAPRGLEVETLICSVCGATFERLRTRGRKPIACPACRAARPGASSPV